MKIFLFNFIAVVLFVSIGNAAQPYEPVQPDPLTETWRYRAFPELKGKGLNSMAEATDGAIWFGLDPGVMRYDGVHLEALYT